MTTEPTEPNESNPPLPYGPEAERAMRERIAEMGSKPWSDEEFEDLLQRVVDLNQPRRFGAVVQILDDNIDAHIAGWVIDFGEDTDTVVVPADCKPRKTRVEKPEHALVQFRCPPLADNRLIWCNPRSEPDATATLDA